MWVTISLILGFITIFTLIINTIKDDEIKKLQYKIGFLEGKQNKSE